MKRGLVIGFFVAWACTLQAQQGIEVLNDVNASYQGTISSEIKVPLRIKNNEDFPVYIYVKRVDNKIGSTQSANFCWGEECFEKSIDKLPISKKIDPGQISEDFTSILHTGLVGGFSTIKYQIYTRGNPSNVLEHEVIYTVEENTKSTTLYSSDALVMNEIYPNPVREFAFIDYTIYDSDTEVKIVIHNVLGSVAGEYKLDHLEKELKIPAKEYNPGVYFYTLYLNGDGVITNKIVFRK